MGYCKRTGRMSCSMVDSEDGGCGTSSGECIYIDEDSDYRDYDDTEENSDDID